MVEWLFPLSAAWDGTVGAVDYGSVAQGAWA